MVILSSLFQFCFRVMTRDAKTLMILWWPKAFVVLSVYFNNVINQLCQSCYVLSFAVDAVRMFEPELFAVLSPFVVVSA